MSNDVQDTQFRHLILCMCYDLNEDFPLAQLDIATKIVDETMSMWVVFAGRQRRFLNTFTDQGVIFLEAPGISLRSNVVTDNSILRQHVRMSDAIQSYHISIDSKRVPARNPDAYSSEAFNDGRLSVFSGNIKKMFSKMNVGDLIITPGKTMFDPIRFGEVISEFSPSDVIQIQRYQNENIPFRKVRWFDRSTPRSVVKQSLQIYLSKPPAISKIRIDADTETFLQYAYPAYVRAHKSAVIIGAPKYTGKNPLDTIEANKIIAYFISAFNAIEKEQLDQFLNAPFSDFEKFYEPDLVLSVSQNFNSPGSFGLIASSAILSAFVSLGVAMVVQPNPESLLNGVQVTNSVSPQHAEIARDAGVKFDYLMKSLGKKTDHLPELKALGDQSKNKIGLTSPVKIK